MADFIKEIIQELNQLKEENKNIIKERNKLEQKLEKIKDRCNKTLEIMNEYSGTNDYAYGRCIEAENILQIIDEVE